VPDDALVLLHGLSRYIPHLIALSARRPSCRATDTGFHSARLNSVFAFPLSGRAPFVTDLGRLRTSSSTRWRARASSRHEGLLLGHPAQARVRHDRSARARHAAHHREGRRAGRLHPVPGALAAHRAAVHASDEDDYLPYTFNRFQACRFGLDGTYVDPSTGEHRTLREDILASFNRLEGHAIDLGAEAPAAVSGYTAPVGMFRTVSRRSLQLCRRQPVVRWISSK
jgi:carboxylate-amine ligase